MLKEIAGGAVYDGVPVRSPAPWNIEARAFGAGEDEGRQCVLLTTDPAPRGSAQLWLGVPRVRRMRADLCRALAADEGGAVYLMVAGIAFTVSEAEALLGVLEGALDALGAA